MASIGTAHAAHEFKAYGSWVKRQPSGKPKFSRLERLSAAELKGYFGQTHAQLEKLANNANPRSTASNQSFYDTHKDNGKVLWRVRFEDGDREEMNPIELYTALKLAAPDDSYVHKPSGHADVYRAAAKEYDGIKYYGRVTRYTKPPKAAKAVKASSGDGDSSDEDEDEDEQ